MSSAVILLIDTEGLHVWRPEDRPPLAHSHFRTDANGQQAFRAFLGENPHAAYTLVINLPGERYLSESIPHLRGQERQRLQSDRLQRHFPDSRWRCAHLLSHGRTDSAQLLLMSLDESPAISLWLQLLQRRRSALLAIHSLAQCGPPLVHQHAPHEDAVLLLARYGDTLRLSWLANGELIASSLQTLPASTDLAAHCRHFLQQLSGDAPWPPPYVLALAIDPPEDGTWGAWQPIETADDATLSSLNALRRHPPREQFAPLSERQHGQRYRRGQRLEQGCWAAALLALLACGGLLTDRQAQHEKLIQTLAQQQESRQQLAALDAEISTLPLTPAPLQRLIDGYTHLRSAQPRLREGLQTLSQALDDNPAITLNALGWDYLPAAPQTIRLHIEAHFSDRQMTEIAAHFQRLTRQLASHGELEIVSNPWQTTAPGHFILRLVLRSTA